MKRKGTLAAVILLLCAGAALAADEGGGWLSSLGNLVGGGLSGVFGGILGAIGTGIQAYTAYKDKQLTFAHEEKKWDQDLRVMDKQREEMIAEAEQAQKLQTIKEEGLNVRSADDLQRASYAHDVPLVAGQKVPDTWMGRWVVYPLFALADWSARMTRPAITLFYTIVTAAVTASLFKSYSAAIAALDSSGESSALLFARVLDMVLFITCMATTWWFGGRALRPAEIRGR